MTSLGEKIRQMRRQRGMTQAELGHGIVSASMMSQIESGRTRPSYALLTNIANKLDMPVEYFLDDFENHFATSARLQLAEFWFLVHDYQKALDVLKEMVTPDAPGADYFHFRYLLARIDRAQGKLHTAVSILEELREHALQTLDNRLLFQIMKESGYVEQALQNPLGAQQEWLRALEIGESLGVSGAVSDLRYRADTAEVCLQLYRLNMQMGLNAEAQGFLEQAKLASSRQTHFQYIAETLVEDGMKTIEDDPGRSRTLIDTGVNVIQLTTFVEQSVLIHTLVNSDKGKNVDPWHETAKAAATLHPELFIQGEVDRIEALLLDGKFERVIERVKRCLYIVEDYMEEIPELKARIPGQLVTLQLAKAQAFYGVGDVSQALVVCEEVLGCEEIPELAVANHSHLRLRTYGLMLRWAQEQNNHALVAKLVPQAESLLRQTFS